MTLGLTLPPIRQAGDTGHLADHNLIRQALLDGDNGKADASALATTNATVTALSGTVGGLSTNVSNLTTQVNSASSTVATLNTRVNALSTVATSGSYVDLSNKPSIPDAYTKTQSDAKYVFTVNGVSPTTGNIAVNAASEVLVLCPGDVAPLRVNTPGDSSLPRKWRKKTAPTPGGGYALEGDTWEADGT